MPAPGDLIHQQSTSTGTGNITLSAVNGKRTFNDEFGTGGTNKFDYFISNQAAAEWERGTGHLSAPTTLARDTVLASSNANAAVNFSAGTKDIANDVPAALQVRGPGSATVGNIPLWDSSSGNLLKDAGYAPREVLTANRTYYVLTTGSDSNTGLANTSGGAFLTIQKAIDTVAALDTNGRNVTIQVGAGTYTGTLFLPYVPGAKAATLQIVGDTTTPSNCLISCTSVFSAIQSAGCGNGWYVRGFKIQTTTTGYCVYAGDQLSTIYLGENDYGGVPSGYSHISARYGGRIAIQTGYTISGGANSHIITNEAGILTLSGTVTVTLSGTPAFSQAFAYALGLSIIEFGSTTWSGSATGSRYKSNQNSIINTFGQSTSWLPGSTAGSTATGGLYA